MSTPTKSIALTAMTRKSSASCDDRSGNSLKRRRAASSEKSGNNKSDDNFNLNHDDIVHLSPYLSKKSCDVLRSELEVLRSELDREKSLRALERRRADQIEKSLKCQMALLIDEAKEARSLLEEFRALSDRAAEQLIKSYHETLEKLRECERKLSMMVDTSSGEEEGTRSSWEQQRDRNSLLDMEVASLKEQLRRAETRSVAAQERAASAETSAASSLSCIGVANEQYDHPSAAPEGLERIERHGSDTMRLTEKQRVLHGRKVGNSVQMHCWMCRKYSEKYVATSFWCRSCHTPLCKIDRTGVDGREQSCYHEHWNSAESEIRCNGKRKKHFPVALKFVLK